MQKIQGWLIGWVMGAVALSAFAAASADTGATDPPTDAQPATRPEALPTLAAPATQPTDADPDRPLFHIGDRVTIRQSDLDAALGDDVERRWAARHMILMRLFEQAIFRIYVEDHPELVTDEQIDQRIANSMRRLEIESLDEFADHLAAHNHTLESYRQLIRLEQARANLVRKGLDERDNEELAAQLWETRREEFDGTFVRLRHIMFRVPHFATPQQRVEVRRILTEMREDMLAGRRTWAECVAESDSEVRQGSLGGLRRHGMGNEFLMRVAFTLEPGELSEIVETPLGYHILQVTERVKGTRTFEGARRDIRRYLEKREQIASFTETYRKYPIVGVHVPARPRVSVAATQPSARPRPPTLADLHEQLAARREAANRPQAEDAEGAATQPAEITDSEPATQPAATE